MTGLTVPAGADSACSIDGRLEGAISEDISDNRGFTSGNARERLHQRYHVDDREDEIEGLVGGSVVLVAEERVR